MNSTHKFWLWYGSFKLMEGLSWLICGVGVLCIFTGAVNLYNNIAHWLKTGVWRPLLTYDVLRDLFPTWSWLHEPTDYFGAWQIVNGIASLPFWFVIPIVGLPFFGVGYVVATLFKFSAKDLMADHRKNRSSTTTPA